MDELLFKKLYKSCLRFLGIRMRSEKEIRTKLQEWIKQEQRHLGDASEVNWLVIEDRVVAQLKRESFLNDRNFAREWISSRLRSKPRGKVLIAMELLQKGIDKELIDEMFEEIIADENASSEQSEGVLFRSALKLGEKNLRKYEHLEIKEARYKLSMSLGRKGFELPLIKRVVDELLSRR